MKIDKVLQSLSAEEFRAIWEATKAQDINAFELSVGEFVSIIEEEEGFFKWATRQEADTINGWFERCKGMLAGIEKVLKAIEGLRLPQTPDEAQACKGINFPSFGATVLLDCVDAYHLSSTEEAERLPLSDWYLVAQRRHAQACYQRNFERIMKSKNGHKS